MTMYQSNSADDAAAAGPADDDKSSSTHFLFTSKVFALPGGFFNISRDGNEAVFNVHLGDVWGKIPFRTLRESFDIGQGTSDDRLLGVVEKGLKYVKEIRPGDSIPREILDGTASWRVDERHLHIAKGRITAQLIAWLTGTEVAVKERVQFEQLLEDPQVKQRAQEAFAKLAAKFGLPEDRKQEVVDRVDSLARELSYIEALRDRYGMVQKIFVKLNQAKRAYKGDNQLQSDVSRMHALAKTPLANFDDIFSQIDGQTAEVMAMLKTYDASVAFIRRMRDELHISLMIWDEMITAWNEHEVDKNVETEYLLKRTYQFLAQHFLLTKVWSRSG